jgi:hypothetical protein
VSNGNIDCTFTQPPGWFGPGCSRRRWGGRPVSQRWADHPLCEEYQRSIEDGDHRHQPDCGWLALADVAVVVAQNEEKLIGPFDPRYFNDSNGFVQITYSSEVDVTVRPIQVK